MLTNCRTRPSNVVVTHSHLTLHPRNNEYKTEAGTSAASFETATMKNYATGEYVDNFETLRTNVDLRSAYAESIAASMNRAYDQVIIDALDAAHTEGGLAANLDNQAVSKTTLITLHKALTDNNVPMSDRYLVIDSFGLQDILQILI